MELTPLHFLIVCPLVGVAGFVDSIAGGGGLISLPAYLISGLPVHTCIATNKLSSSMEMCIRDRLLGLCPANKDSACRG